MKILKKYNLSDLGIKIKGTLGIPTQEDKSVEGLRKAKAIILREFQFVDSYLMNDFIVEAKNFFEQEKSDKGKRYKAFYTPYGIAKNDDNQGLINTPLTKTIIIPADRKSELNVVIDQDEKDRKNFENVSQIDDYLERINGFQFIFDFGYNLYNDGKINSQLIKFDARFEDLVKRLIEVRLERPSISMGFAMKLVINELKTGEKITGNEVELFDNNDFLHNISLIIKNKLRLYMTPQQEAELRQIRVLQRFKNMDCDMVAQFIANAKSVIADEKFEARDLTIANPKSNINTIFSSMKYIIPANHIGFCKGVYYKPGDQCKVYEQVFNLSRVDYFSFDSDCYYDMYTTKNGLNQKLLMHNLEFKTIFNDLVKICLDEPDISMEEVFNKAIDLLKKRMTLKVRTLSEAKKG